jgi:hypothetical protein
VADVDDLEIDAVGVLGLLIDTSDGLLMAVELVCVKTSAVEELLATAAGDECAVSELAFAVLAASDPVIAEPPAIVIVGNSDNKEEPLRRAPIEASVIFCFFFP